MIFSKFYHRFLAFFILVGKMIFMSTLRYVDSGVQNQYKKSERNYRTCAIIGRSRFEAALVYKLRILSLKNEEFPFLVHKLSAI